MSISGPIYRVRGGGGGERGREREREGERGSGREREDNYDIMTLLIHTTQHGQSKFVS